MGDRSVADWAAGEWAARAFCIGGEVVPRDWALRRLAHALDHLRSIDRQLLLAFGEGFCTKEIAARYGMSVHNVKVRAHRARRRMRRELEDAVRIAARGDA